MNMRTLLIIAGLALPIVTFAILSQSLPESPKTTVAMHKTTATNHKRTETKHVTVSPGAGQIPKNVKPGPMSAPPVILPPLSKDAKKQVRGYMTLQQAIDKVKNRLAYLENMDATQWPVERLRHKNAPPTLYQAKSWNRNRLAQLATMTEKQWNMQQQEALARAMQAAAGKPKLPTLNR